jgi:GT2 family glycosyltransferase
MKELMQHAPLAMNRREKPPRIGVVTVLFNSAQVLPEFMQSIASQRETEFIVIAIDNASSDGSAEICSTQQPAYIIIKNDLNVGVAAANNQGIRIALDHGCEYILLLNNDTVFEPDLFQKLVLGMTDHECEMTTPLCFYTKPSNKVWCAGGGFNALMGYRQIHYGDGEENIGQFKARRVQYCPTCCVLIHRNVFERVGLMDEAYFVYWDDTDFMLRAHRAGISLFFLPDAILYHKVSSLTGVQSSFTVRMNTRNHAYYLKKHLGKLHASLFTFIYCAFYSLMFVSGGDRRASAKLRLRSWREGLRMVCT